MTELSQNYYPEQSPYGSSTAGTQYKDARYKRHAEWIEPLVYDFTSRLSKGHTLTCENCGASLSLTANIIRRHLATEKHLRSIDKWTEQDETEMMEYKKTCRGTGRGKLNKTKSSIIVCSTSQN